MRLRCQGQRFCDSLWSNEPSQAAASGQRASAAGEASGWSDRLYIIGDWLIEIAHFHKFKALREIFSLDDDVAIVTF